MSKETNWGSDAWCLAGMTWSGILSYLKWHSLGWAVIHSIFSWLYVVYYFIRF